MRHIVLMIYPLTWGDAFSNGPFSIACNLHVPKRRKHWTFQPRVLMCFGRLLWELLLVLALPNGNAVFDTFERVGDGFCLDSLSLVGNLACIVRFWYETQRVATSFNCRQFYEISHGAGTGPTMPSPCSRFNITTAVWMLAWSFPSPMQRAPGFIPHQMETAPYS